MQTLGELIVRIFDWVVRTSWQASILVILILAVQVIFRKKLSPGWRYGLWFLLLARLLMPAPPPSPLSIFNVAGMPESLTLEVSNPREEISPPGEVALPESRMAPVRVPSFMESQNEPVKQLKPMSWLDVLIAFWLSGMCVFGLRFLVEHIHFRRRLRSFLPIDNPQVLESLQECAAALGLRTCPIIIETEEVESPAVWGLWRKRLLVPDGMFESFSGTELRHIFLHELAHIKRRDLEISWLVELLRVFYWFNPLLWLAFARMRQDRELATDALALAPARQVAPRAYGETILKLVERLNRPSLLPHLVGIVESKASIKQRLGAIVQTRAYPWRWAAGALALGIAIVGLTDAITHANSNGIVVRRQRPSEGSFSPGTRLLDRAPRELRHVIPRLWAVAFSPDGNKLAITGGWDKAHEPGELVVWDILSRKTTLALRQKSTIRTVAFSSSGKLLAMGDFAGVTKLVDPNNGKTIRTLPRQTELVNSVVFTPDDTALVTSSFDGTITFWNVSTGKEMATFSLPDESIVKIAVSSDNRLLAAVTRSGKAHLWDIIQRKELHSLQASKENVAEAVAFAPDGNSFITGSWDSTLRLWDSATGRLLRDLAGQQSAVLSAEFSPDGRTLASGDGNGSVLLFDITNGRRIASLQAHSEQCFGLAFSHDGKYLATASWDRTAKIWDMETREPIATLVRAEH
jgi:bla regulator protein BlaR1